MRALCGAIITAGALIGLGLTAIGLGMRYQSFPHRTAEGQLIWVSIRHLDTSFLLVLTLLVIALVVGICVAFIGLAYHHHRRHLEILHHQSQRPQERMPV